MVPLKTQGVVDSSTVDDIFYKVNELYMYHATFLVFLARVAENWTRDSTVGDVIYNTVSHVTIY